MTTTPYVKSSERVADAYDGRSAKEIAATLALPRVVLFEEIGSTLDVAHRLGEEGAAAGTLVLADAQTAGRGRMGRSWQSEPGAGIWLTLLERPSGDDALTVLALRLALALGPALDAGHNSPVPTKKIALEESDRCLGIADVEDEDHVVQPNELAAARTSDPV